MKMINNFDYILEDLLQKKFQIKCIMFNLCI